jgi:3-hydroxybutyrate dehydrogenase
VAEAFLRAGASLAILAEDGGVHQAAKEMGPGVRALEADIADRAAVEHALGPLDRIDILVNNAGIERLTPVDDASPETDATFRRILDINVNGTWNVTRAALPRMRTGGRIILTSSIWGKTAEACFSAYAASKHANIGMVRSLAKELGPRGIRVNAVCPGWVRTESSLRSAAVMAARNRTTPEAVLQDVVAGQALGGLMEPSDVAGLYLFLASDAAASITGQAFTIDRGETLQ